MDEHFYSPEILIAEDGSYRPLCPVTDEYVAGEIVNRWYHREQSRRLKDLHEGEMLGYDAELAELLFRMKQKLSRLGRNGQWSLCTTANLALNGGPAGCPICGIIRPNGSTAPPRNR